MSLQGAAVSECTLGAGRLFFLDGSVFDAFAWKESWHCSSCTLCRHDSLSHETCWELIFCDTGRSASLTRSVWRWSTLSWILLGFSWISVQRYYRSGIWTCALVLTCNIHFLLWLREAFGNETVSLKALNDCSWFVVCSSGHRAKTHVWPQSV